MDKQTITVIAVIIVAAFALELNNYYNDTSPWRNGPMVFESYMLTAVIYSIAGIIGVLLYNRSHKQSTTKKAEK